MYIMKTFGFTKEDVAEILKNHLECNVGEDFKEHDQVTLNTENQPNGHDFRLGRRRFF